MTASKLLQQPQPGWVLGPVGLPHGAGTYVMHRDGLVFSVGETLPKEGTNERGTLNELLAKTHQRGSAAYILAYFAHRSYVSPGRSALNVSRAFVPSSAVARHIKTWGERLPEILRQPPMVAIPTFLTFELLSRPSSLAPDPQSGPLLTDSFQAVPALVEMVIDGLKAHRDQLASHRIDVAIAQLTDDALVSKAQALTTARILECIAARARKMRMGAIKQAPLAKDGRFDYGFVRELARNIPFREDANPPFASVLLDQMTNYLARGGKISGAWGALKPATGLIEYELAQPQESGDRWEQATKVEIR